MTAALHASRLPEGQALLTTYDELTRPKVRASWALSEAILLAARPDQREALWQDIHLLELRRDTTAFIPKAERERAGTRRRLELLGTRAAMSDSRLDLSAAPTSASTVMPVPFSSPHVRRGRSRSP